MRDDRERLRDINEAIDKIEKYVSLGYQAFIEDERTQVWIIHHLQLIGEASNHLSDELTERNQDIPWADIVGLRKSSCISILELISGKFGRPQSLICLF